jgi:hypothetical protein
MTIEVMESKSKNWPSMSIDSEICVKLKPGSLYEINILDQIIKAITPIISKSNEVSGSFRITHEENSICVRVTEKGGDR